MGYAGGTKDNPTYRDMGGHSETIEVIFDPGLIDYETLLDLFWKNHNSLRTYRSRQYLSILFYHTEEQKEAAQIKKMEWEQILGGQILTEMVPLSHFFQAEDYHQKYYLKRYKSVIETIKSWYSNEQDFVNSTLTARLNAFVKGYGTWDGINLEIQDWELPPADKGFAPFLAMVEEADPFTVVDRLFSYGFDCFLHCDMIRM